MDREILYHFNSLSEPLNAALIGTNEEEVGPNRMFGMQGWNRHALVFNYSNDKEDKASGHSCAPGIFLQPVFPACS